MACLFAWRCWQLCLGRHRDGEDVNYFTKLINAIERNQSLLCVGLDPVEAMLPEGADIYQRLTSWGTNLMAGTADLVCCFKPNMAFFEQFGLLGLQALADIIISIPPDLPVILDAKRGDIGSSAAAYARAIYDQFHADAVTLSPYLGRDSVSAFLDDPDKAAFVLCQTSNPSAKEVQQYGDPPLYEFIARRAQTWGSPDQIGLVIGATQPAALEKVRQICPDTWFLAPGVGAQGGNLELALQAGLRTDGLGMIIPVSRSVLNAEDPHQAALELRDAINAVRATVASKPTPADAEKEKLILDLFESGCVKFGHFTLASGKQSPIYIDLRRVVSFPELFNTAATAYVNMLSRLDCDLVAGVPYAALPLGAVTAWKLGKPLIYSRKEAKTHGTGQNIEGAYQAGQRAVLIEDVITSGGSILAAAETLRAGGLVVEDVVVLVDREQGGAAALAQEGIRVHAVLNIYEVLQALKDRGFIDTDTHAGVTAYLQG